jgi:Polyketide cyclase / dehydrase and lipid transport
MSRYADAPTITVETTIHAPRARVWLIVIDPGLPVRTSEELIDAHWGEHPTGAPGIGSTIIGRSQHPTNGEWTTTSIVTDWQPELRFEWAVREIENSAARWRFELETVNESTVLRQWYQIGPGTSGVARWIAADPDNEEQIIADRLKFQAANMERTLDLIKNLSETS